MKHEDVISGTDTAINIINGECLDKIKSIMLVHTYGPVLPSNNDSACVKQSLMIAAYLLIKSKYLT